MKLLLLSITGNKRYEVEVDNFETTIGQIIEILSTKYDLDHDRIILISKGKRMTEHSNTLEFYNVNEKTPIILHMIPESMIKPKKQTKILKAETVPEDNEAPEIETEKPPEAEAEAEAEPEPETRIYSNIQVKTALKQDPFILLDILQIMAMGNPFLLSYIATTPQNVKDMLARTLANSDFKLKVVVMPGTNDPIMTALNSAPLNPYLVDKQNVERIMERIGNSAFSFEYVKDAYLLLNRNIEQTVQFLSGSNN